MADISFIVVDLKYSKDRGVKICEIQPGSFSRFSGSDVLEGKSTIENQYCSLVGKYQYSGYFIHPLHKEMKKALIQHGWSSIHSIEEMLPYLKLDRRGDPDNLFDYEACLFSVNPQYILQKDPSSFPQILFLDRAILPYSQNKYIMNSLCDQVEMMKKLRPVWKVYRKGASDELIQRIHSDIPGDIVVVKPIQSTMGRGVIIVEKKDLQETLNYVFFSPKELLLQDLERSYSQYAIDTSNSFIVEEFILSDPLYLGKDSLPYDCTMRVMAALVYQKKEANLIYLSSYWYSPHKPMDPSYTLIQSHKAKGTYFHEVSADILEEVKRQLFPACLEAYRYMLDE